MYVLLYLISMRNNVVEQEHKGGGRIIGGDPEIFNLNVQRNVVFLDHRGVCMYMYGRRERLPTL